MDCLLPLLFQSLTNPTVALPDYFTQAPARLNGQVAHSIRPGKLRYGQEWPNERASANFLVAWENGNGNNALADRTLATLEKTWSALVETAQWQQPVSSDNYLLWVILSPELSGTGFTTSYTNSEFPKGYPVMYLNPSYAQDTDFWDSLSAHEFAHALQYAHRSYSTNPEEPWYWEASAEWQAELALPEVNAYAQQSWYYAEQSHFRYSSIENSHQYGMFVLNAHIEEHLSGPGSLKSIWELAAKNPNKNWDVLIAEALGEPVEAVFGGFTQSMAAMDFQDAAHYYPPKSSGKLKDQSTGSLGYLGTHYWNVKADAWVQAEGEVMLASQQGLGEKVVVRAGERLAVTGLNPADLGAYTLTVGPIPEDSGLVDSGDSGGEDSGSSEKESPSTCACSTGPSQKAPFWILAGACLFSFKRRAPTRPFSS